MYGGLPLAMLAAAPLRRSAVGRGRAVALGPGRSRLQALSCAYYGIFAGLMVGLAVRLLRRQPRLWRSAARTGARSRPARRSSIASLVPFFLPYVRRAAGPGLRAGHRRGRADLLGRTRRAWLASSAWAHRWWLPAIEAVVNEVLFPGLSRSRSGSPASGSPGAARRRGAEAAPGAHARHRRPLRCSLAAARVLGVVRPRRRPVRGALRHHPGVLVPPRAGTLRPARRALPGVLGARRARWRRLLARTRRAAAAAVGLALRRGRELDVAALRGRCAKRSR